MSEPTIIEQLTAEAAAATAQVETLKDELTLAQDAASETAAALEGARADLATALEQVTALTAELETVKTDLEGSKSEAAAAMDLAAAAEERAQKAEGALARDPETLRQLKLAGDGQPAPSAASGSDGQQPTTWKEAVASCGGDYVTARRRFHKVWETEVKKQQ